MREETRSEEKWNRAHETDKRKKAKSNKTV